MKKKQIVTFVIRDDRDSRDRFSLCKNSLTCVPSLVPFLQILSSSAVDSIRSEVNITDLLAKVQGHLLIVKESCSGISVDYGGLKYGLS